MGAELSGKRLRAEGCSQLPEAGESRELLPLGPLRVVLSYNLLQ